MPWSLCVTISALINAAVPAMSSTRIIAVVLLAAVGGGYWYYSSQSGAPAPAAAKPAAGPVPVTVATAVSRDVPITLEVVGRAEASESVVLKSRVDGQVLAVPFTEGQLVAKGDVLIKLDPADFQARLNVAEAAVARDQVQLAKARADVARTIALKERGFVSEEKVSDVKTTVAALEATLRADQATAELARLQLNYTTLRAPFAGVMGGKNVFAGAGVKNNDTALATLNRMDPINVSFAVPERHLPALQAAMNKGVAKVGIQIPGDKTKLEGEVRFLDNVVDTTTGTIVMKAGLANPERKLTPGQFVNVSLVVRQVKDAVLVPSAAIQQGPESSLVFVVKGDGVEIRKVELAATQAGQAVVARGLAGGDLVVIDGHLRLAPGSKVKPRMAGKDDGKKDGAKAPEKSADDKPAAGKPTAASTQPVGNEK